MNKKTFYLMLVIPLLIFSFSLQAQVNNLDINSGKNNGIITSESMSTWTPQVSGVTGFLFTVRAVDMNVGWAAGSFGKILRTTNAGINWINLSTTQITSHIYCMAAISKNVCLVATSPDTNAHVYRTTNGGVTWTQVFVQASGYIEDIRFKNSTTGFMIGNPVGGRWSLWKTTDAGSTWDSTGLYLPGVNVGSWSNTMQISDNEIWFGTNNTKIYHSTNFGSEWSYGITTGALLTYSVTFNSGLGFAGVDASAFSSTNGGANWFEITLPGTSCIYAFNNIGPRFFYGRGIEIYYSSNNGTSFDLQYNFTQTVLAMDFILDGNRIRGWATGANGEIAMYEEITSASNYGLIYGYMFKDQNGNGTWDSGEPPFPYTPVKVTSGSATLFSYSNNLGFYQFFISPGTYTVSIASVPLYYNLLPANYIVPITDSGQVVGPKNFALTKPPGIQDVEIYLTNIGMLSPGFTFQYKLNYKNPGSTTPSSTVLFDFDNRLTDVSSDPPGTITGNQIIWNYSNLLPDESRDIIITAKIPASVPLNSGICATGTVNPITGDLTPYNNVTTTCDTVRGSYDPNDKAVNHTKFILPLEISRGDSLIYIIRFQNTGTAEAINIAVLDTIDSNLNWGTFQMISTSHPCYFDFNQNGFVTWHFDNIMLPDSNTNEPASHGFIKYRIKPKTTLILGDTIKNTAYIYFDFNEPVITNTVINVVSNTPPGVTPISNEIPGEFKLFQNFPNPFNPTTNIKFDIPKSSFVKLIVYDILGREVAKLVNEKLNAGTYLVDWDGSGYPSGVYFCRMTTEKFTDIKKLTLLK
ncbi:MAG: T9SS type A sorting domain-containing protein [Bacteroidetes bacterium]|nr:T9SS type A sorting domain-containing protein [Bacteroidota bacterium]